MGPTCRHDPAEIDDVILGAALQQGATGGSIARQAALRGPASDGARDVGGPPVRVGAHVDRPRLAQVTNGDLRMAVAGGVEAVSLVQNEHMNTHRAADPWLKENVPGIYLPMLNTAEIVAQRYGITRDAQDAYALTSQQRTAAAQENGLFDDEIVPLATVQGILDRKSGDVSFRDTVLRRDEGSRPSTTIDSVAGVAPDEMGIGPVPAVTELLRREGLSVDDVDLWELSEAFASQVVYCRDALGIDPDKLSVNGGAISIGHPHGMSGARMVRPVPREGRRRGAKLAVVTMCIGGGQGAAAVLEVL